MLKGFEMLVSFCQQYNLAPEDVSAILADWFAAQKDQFNSHGDVKEATEAEGRRCAFHHLTRIMTGEASLPAQCEEPAQAQQVFSFEKHMGETVLRFEVTVQLLGIDPPETAISCSLGSMPATPGESLWFVTVEGPAGAHPVGYRSYSSSVDPADVAKWALPIPGCTPC